jgi:nucleoside-diphosphate-sugar epimerase
VKSLPITGTGDETRDFNFVQDTIEGSILAASHEEALGKIYNIGSGRETRIKDLVGLIRKYFNNKVEVEMIGRRGWDRIPNRRANITRASEELGYRAKVSLEEGLQKTYEWFAEYVW